MLQQQSIHVVRLGVGGVSGGLGIAGYKSWIIAFVILLVLAGLARWTMRPARRPARAKRRTSQPESTQAISEHAGADQPIPCLKGLRALSSLR